MWIRFRNTDPDPQRCWIRIQFGSGSTTLETIEPKKRFSLQQESHRRHKHCKTEWSFINNKIHIKCNVLSFYLWILLILKSYLTFSLITNQYILLVLGYNYKNSIENIVLKLMLKIGVTQCEVLIYFWGLKISLHFWQCCKTKTKFSIEGWALPQNKQNTFLNKRRHLDSKNVFKKLAGRYEADYLFPWIQNIYCLYIFTFRWIKKNIINKQKCFWVT